jgi:hypothetical protein
MHGANKWQLVSALHSARVQREEHSCGKWYCPLLRKRLFVLLLLLFSRLTHLQDMAVQCQ